MVLKELPHYDITGKVLVKEHVMNQFSVLSENIWNDLAYNSHSIFKDSEEDFACAFHALFTITYV